ncbi:MAG: transcription elongation factor GreA [Alphaproteobacteria bacterium]|nr:transcription elongation factor GreA [Alphaproteobacteria bacterium]
MTRHPLTPEGYARMETELRHAKEVLRPSIVRDIEEARAHGDISENSEYEDAKERQSLCEARIQFLETVVAGADIIDITKLDPDGRVVFGCTVLLEDAESGEQRRWRIVGETEADVEGGCISYRSPVGKAVIGREEGDEVTVPTPAGPRRWEIVEVHYKGPDAA